MNEGLEEPKIEEPLPVLNVPGEFDLRAETAVPPRIDKPATVWLRLAYAIEFLLACMVVFPFWSEVGGQGHLDLLPWYVKLVCGLAFSWAVMRFTAAIVEREQLWNGRAVIWFAGICMVVAVMGGITYYYHLHELPDDESSDDSTATSVSIPPSVERRQSL